MIGETRGSRTHSGCLFTFTGFGKAKREQKVMPGHQLQGLPFSIPFSLVKPHLPKILNQCPLLGTKHSLLRACGNTTLPNHNRGIGERVQFSGLLHKINSLEIKFSVVYCVCVCVHTPTRTGIYMSVCGDQSTASSVILRVPSASLRQGLSLA